MDVGHFLIEAPATSLDGVYCDSVNHSRLSFNVRGCGTSYAGLRLKWGVVNEIRITVSGNEGGWYSKPYWGLYLDERAGGDASAYNVFVDPVLEGTDIGCEIENSIGNLFLGGTMEGCTIGGLKINDVTANWNKTIGTDFEANGVYDITCDGIGNEFITTDTFTEIIFTANAKNNKVSGGSHKNITLDSGARTTIISGITIDRFGNIPAGTITDNGTDTLIRDVVDNAGTVYYSGLGNTTEVTVSEISTEDSLGNEKVVFRGNVADDTLEIGYVDAPATNGFLRLYAAGSEYARLDADGSFMIGTQQAGADAILDVTSTTKGILFPRLTTSQKTAMSAFNPGLVVYDTDLDKLSVWNGSSWGALQAPIAEVNDLSAAVTWANVPDANIVESSVTQHEAALSITESQITDLGFHQPTFKVANDIYDAKDASAITPVSDLTTAFDGNSLDHTETSGAPGFDIEVNFTGVTSLKGIVIRSYYIGGATHYVQISLYNYNTTNQDVITQVGSTLGFEYRTMLIPDDTNYIDGSGNAQISFIHPTTGIGTHHMHIDYVALLAK